MARSVESKARLAFAALVLLGVVGVVAWVLLASGRESVYEIRTRDAVSGLIPDAPVEFHGVDVGKVRRVELVDAHSVSILLGIRRDAPVTTATVATITGRGLATRGFTGYVVVALEDAGTDAQPLLAAPGEPFPVIRAAPSRSVSLDTTIGQVNENVQQMSELLRSLLDPKTVASLKQSADSLQQVTRTLATDNEKLNAIILNGEHASRQLEPLLQSSNDTVKALQTQVLPEAHRTLANLERLSTSLNGVASKVERDPSVLVRGAAAPRPGPGEGR